MSLLANLPAPTKQHAAPIQAIPASAALVTTSYKEPPPYLRRQGWVPRRADDFGDGGAFPEIHVAQYPLDMGKGGGGKGSQQLAVTLNADGQINYDAVVKQGSNRDRIVHTSHGALVPKVDRLSKEALARPDDEEIEKTVKETAAALERVVQGKLSSTNPSKLPNQPGSSTLIKYTPAQQGQQYASGAGQRIIKMQDMPVDPLEPPKFRHVKVPRGPGSPPVPVLHSPPRPLSVKDQQDWKIPPSISNWKNPKGYTIPLDKRLAADGRGLQQTQINDKFASLSEALFTAEAKAREAIAMRASIQKELALKEKNKREAELRQLAMQARMERQGGAAAGGAGAGGMPPPPPPLPGGAAARADAPLPGPPPGPPPRGARATAADAFDDFDRRDPRDGGGGRDRDRDRDYDRERDRDYERDRDRGGHDRDRDYDRGGRGGGGDDERYHESVEEREERRRRDEIREERRRERERERRLEAANQGGAKKSKITRDRERDISEKVALGMANVGTGAEVQYDQRLFNQDAGMQSGFGPDDAYNMYDKPLFADRGGHLFKASRATADDEGDAGPSDAGPRTDRFRPDKGFEGAEPAPGAAAARGGGGRLEFERQAAATAEEADPFGLDQFLSEVKGGGRERGGRKGNALDAIGQRGGMSAAGGGASLEDAGAGAGMGRRMQFTSGSGR